MMRVSRKAERVGALLVIVLLALGWALTARRVGALRSERDAEAGRADFAARVVEAARVEIERGRAELADSLAVCRDP
jgi:ABC-type methionine transport system permease subunit